MIPVRIDYDGRPYGELEMDLAELPLEGETIEIALGGEEPATLSGRVLRVTRQYLQPTVHPYDASKRRLTSVHLSLTSVLNYRV